MFWKSGINENWHLWTCCEQKGESEKVAGVLEKKLINQRCAKLVYFFFPASPAALLLSDFCLAAWWKMLVFTFDSRCSRIRWQKFTAMYQRILVFISASVRLSRRENKPRVYRMGLYILSLDWSKTIIRRHLYKEGNNNFSHWKNINEIWYLIFCLQFFINFGLALNEFYWF